MDTNAPRPLEPCLQHCPALIRETLGIIAAKWTVPLFLSLHQAGGAVRFAELRRRLGSITSKELAKHLRGLETAGLVLRRVFPTVPPSVEYSLTPLGQTLYPILEQLAFWAARHGDEVSRSREA